MSQRTLSPQKYITLAEAVKLNNKVTSSAAFVFDAKFVKPVYADVLPKDSEAQFELKRKAFLKSYERSKNEPLNYPNCWVLRDISILNAGQREELIREGKMYYAPELKNYEKAKMLAGVND